MAFRGIYRENMGPTCFGTAEEVHMHQALSRETPSSPLHPRHHHSISVLTDWTQVQHFLWMERNKRIQQPPPSSRKGRFAYAHPQKDTLLRSLHWEHYAMNDTAVLNTLHYLFFHMRCGIYVMIHNGELEMMVPFANDHFVNNWQPLTDASRTKSQRRKRGRTPVASQESWWATRCLLIS